MPQATVAGAVARELILSLGSSVGRLWQKRELEPEACRRRRRR